jgi:hypothetical protein
MSTYKKIDSKEQGVTVTFKTPLSENLSRTGTLGDGSCFFHALLYGLNPEYKYFSTNKKIKSVEVIRDELSKSIDIDEWEKLGNGAIAEVSYNEIYNQLLNFFYNVVEDPEKFLKTTEDNLINTKLIEMLFMGKFIGSYEKLFSLLYIDDFEKEILVKAFSLKEKIPINDVDKFILAESKKILLQRIKDKVKGGEKYKVEDMRDLINTLYEMLSTIAKTARPIAYNKFIKSLESCNYWVDNFLIEYISKYIDRDIYIIDDKTRIPYNLGNCEMYKGRKSIVILWIGRTHYESIGKVINKGGKNEIVREFEPDDPIIERMYALLCDPEKVVRDYPELVQYLPKETRELI